jgi:hypothetical protein
MSVRNTVFGDWFIIYSRETIIKFGRGRGLDGRLILIRILNKQDMMVRTGFIWLWTGSSGGLL